MTRTLGALAALAALAAAPAAADDQGAFGRVIRIDRSAFQADAGSITFSEFAVGTTDPVYRPADYGSGGDGVTVRFGGILMGQRLGGPPDRCLPAAAPTGCVSGAPQRPLAFDARGPRTEVVRDGANPRSPSLSGTPRFNGPVTMIFSADVAGVGLTGGHFDAAEGTAIEAYDRAGRLIGGVVNLGQGMETLALVTEDGADRIAAVQFSLVGAEPEGFGIDDLTFARAGQINRARVPGLATLRPDAAGAPAPAAGGSLADIARGVTTPGGAPAPAPAAPADGCAGSLAALAACATRP